MNRVGDVIFKDGWHVFLGINQSISTMVADYSNVSPRIQRTSGKYPWL